MTDGLPIFLADSDDVVKIFVGIIVFVIWGIGALANLAKKQGKASQQSREAMEQAMRQQMEEARRREAAAAALGQRDIPQPPRIPSARPPAVPPLPPVLQQQQRPQRGPMVPPVRMPQQMPSGQVRRPAQAPQAPRPQQQQPKRKQQKRRTSAPPVPVQPFADEGREGPSTPGVAVSEIGQGSTAASPSRRRQLGVSAPMVGFQLNPQTLRQQIVLSEILQPPLALRDHPLGA